MKKQLILALSIISLLGLAVSAQQNVTIKPGDDVLAIVETVVDDNSTITFEAGYYKVLPREDGTGFPDFMNLPSGTTVQGAGSGLDPNTATILDSGFACDSIIKIDDNVVDCVVKDITVMKSMVANVELDPFSIDNHFENVWFLRGEEQTLRCSGWATFDHCVFGYSADDTIRIQDEGFCVFTNCDIFLDPSDIVRGRHVSESYYRNCIFYAKMDGDDFQQDDTSLIQVAASIVWDSEDGDASQAPGDFSISGMDAQGSLIDADVVAADPLYVVAPGSGVKMVDMDLHLREGSPALTAGSTSFDGDNFANGTPTYAGSQGPAPEPVQVKNWSLF